MAAVCRPADALANRTVTDLKALATTTDTLRRAMLDSLKLSATRASDVSYVTDERTCSKALNALNTHMGTANQQRQLYVYKFGTDYLVEDPTIGADSEYRGLRIFDRKWVFKRVYLAY